MNNSAARFEDKKTSSREERRAAHGYRPDRGRQHLIAVPEAVSSFPILAVKGIADINPEAAKARAAEFGVPAMSVADLIADPAVEIVVNLTVPRAHVEVGLQAIAAGKHVHSEKPLGVTVAEGKKLIDAAKAKGRPRRRRAGHLHGRRPPDVPQADRRRRYRPGNHRHRLLWHARPRRWHPSPAFYYLQGGGPVLDMGPYYITALVNLLGPVKRVARHHVEGAERAPITSEPLKGQMMPVEVATHAAATLEFWNGAIVTVVLSFDIPRYRHAPIELYGLTGTLGVPDPNWMDGEILIATADQDWKSVPIQHGHAEHNLRIMAVADMASAIRSGRPHRASGDLAFHVLEVMEAFQRSSDEGRHIEMTTRPERPAMIAGSPQDRRVRLIMKKALIVWGGWSGHEPEQCARIIREMLSAENFDVRVADSTAAFADPAIADLNLIVPIITQIKIEKEELANLSAAVKGGVGIGGFHGGMGDSFREAVEYQFMVGGQWVGAPRQHHRLHREHHPADDAVVAGIGDFPYRSEQYYMHDDPLNEVLATTTFTGEHAPWVAGAVMPVVWKKHYGKGRVFYSALGHVASEFNVPQMKEIVRRGPRLGGALASHLAAVAARTVAAVAAGLMAGGGIAAGDAAVVRAAPRARLLQFAGRGDRGRNLRPSLESGEKRADDALASARGGTTRRKNCESYQRLAHGWLRGGRPKCYATLERYISLSNFYV